MYEKERKPVGRSELGYTAAMSCQLDIKIM